MVLIMATVAAEFDDQFVGGRHANLGRLVR
jgi:hypothetical protein